MTDKTLATTFFSDRLRSNVGTQAPTPRRTTHGSCAWSLPSRLEVQRQPQDGAQVGARPNGSIRSIDERSFPSEAEDARLSGGLRSLARRVRGLNVITYVVRPSAPPSETYFAEHQPALQNVNAQEISARKRPEVFVVQHPRVA